MDKSTGKSAVSVGLIASSVSLALTTMVCLIIRFISGRVSTNHTKCAELLRREPVNSNTTDYNITTNPVYDDIMYMAREIRPREKYPELEENVAYKT